MLQLLTLVCLSAYGAWCGFRAYSDYVFEDAYITIRYARNLADGAGFAFNPGERVLGTTTPLLTLLLALFGRLGMDLELVADVLAALGLFGVALLGGLVARRLGAPNAGILFALATVFGFSRIYNYWGLETTLVLSLAFAAVLAMLHERPIWAGVLVGLAFLTRYDAALLAIAIFLVMWIHDRRVPWKPAWVSLAVVTPWLVFATLYFGSPLPNTLQAKAGQIGFATYLHKSFWVAVEDMWPFLDYLPIDPALAKRWAMGLTWMVVLGLVFAIRILVQRVPRAWALLMYALGLWVGYSWIGPPLSFRWYLTPFAFTALLLGLAGWSVPMKWLRWPAAVPTLGTLLIVLGAVGFLSAESQLHARSFTEDRIYENRIGGYRQAAEWILKAGMQDATLYTSEPGFLAYLTGNPVIDS
ncbi:MAG TPA: hypothetical protein P5218_02410, partial [Planctomycetota bacterium]|nr:hypothetical protein [Planctomycetota bacterium]